MMRVIFTFVVLITCTVSALAQRDIPLRTVKSDFCEASVVVRMDIIDSKITGSDEHMYEFDATGRVTTSFKGKFKAGQLVKFHVRAEYGYDHDAMRGDYIGFLTSFVDRIHGPFQVLPSGNSVIPYSSDLLGKVRTVRRQIIADRKKRPCVQELDEP